MKPLTYLIGSAFTAGIVGISTLSAEPATDDPFGNEPAAERKTNKKSNKKSEKEEPITLRHIRTQVEFIEMPLESMVALLDDKKAASSDTALHQQARKLVASGKAKIIDTELITCRSGEQVAGGAGREYIYPTEYEPAEIPNEIHIHKTNGQAAKGQPQNYATGPTPTAFETQNLGSSYKLVASLSDDDKVIDLEINIDIVTHVENFVWTSWKDERGIADIQMPIFYRSAVHSRITLLDNQPCLIGSFSPKMDHGKTDYSRKILVFAKPTVIKSK